MSLRSRVYGFRVWVSGLAPGNIFRVCCTCLLLIPKYVSYLPSSLQRHANLRPVGEHNPEKGKSLHTINTNTRAFAVTIPRSPVTYILGSSP